ncbi:mandelate racemase/muconate lactonizing enzyme family protein [Mesorhizobium sp. VK25A]|uniref:Mandelate racemase/muconate lactonizing enzyme family protein n=1 Tax=Mesorhizobium vachelliae TaxID=3072309 RepID=A0ABU5AB29_9HYPH|nr:MULTISPECIES: mandelate racemase/muconate lactonizing enzyme family protein [unclassified Mesorhizobium]MDX8534737.1 mandelate racemase/muconate lactonizing enzyme family protein [Mesorhizobium sp. VK25D]MDX8547380.1 mandelate racemase/muconate lactonizing enzyme family protein [Mesorhizobium sp. VK25A]
MRIDRINVYSAQLPVKGGVYRMASADVEALDSTLVEIATDDGFVGWGETCPIGPVYQPHHALGARAAIAEIAPGLIGSEIASIRLLSRQMDERLNGHGYAKAAFDMAFLDLLGQKLGVSVSTLLGGALTDRVPAYYSLIVGAPDETARIAADKVKAGYPRLQVKIGGRDLEEDVAVIHKVWEAVGYGARIAVDGNRGLTVAAAIHLDRLCQAIPFVLEQPCNTMDEIATLKGRVTHPVYLDESTEDQNAVLRAISMGIADGFGFKVTRLGGLTKMTTVRDLCAIRSLPHSCDDAWGGDIIAAACVHLAATVEPRRMEGAWIAQEYIKGHFDQKHPVVIKQGHIAVPQRPGLGVKPEPGMFGKPVAIYGP